MVIEWQKYKFPLTALMLAILLTVVLMIRIGLNLYSKPIPKEVAVPTFEPTPQSQPNGLGSEIYDGVSNPANNVPETNPFNKSSNPISDAYQNPFE